MVREKLERLRVEQAKQESAFWAPPAGYEVNGIPCCCMELVGGEHDAQCEVARDQWLWDEADLAYDLMEDK